MAAHTQGPSWDVGEHSCLLNHGIKLALLKASVDLRRGPWETNDGKGLHSYQNLRFLHNKSSSHCCSSFPVSWKSKFWSFLLVFLLLGGWFFRSPYFSIPEGILLRYLPHHRKGLHQYEREVAASWFSTDDPHPHSVETTSQTQKTRTLLSILWTSANS